MISAEDELFYLALRERAAKWRRDQVQRQATVDASYSTRRDAVVEADVAAMLADVDDEAIERMMQHDASDAR